MRNKRTVRNLNILPAVVVAIAMTFIPLTANSCPFCSAVARTFAEQMDSSDIVVVASLCSEVEETDQARLPRGMFKVVSVLKGDFIKTDDEFQAVVVSRNLKPGEKFLVMGTGTDAVNWTTPLKVSDAVVDYLQQLDSLPEKGADRLAFFAEHFEHRESVLAYDAYDEFARAPYDDVKQLRDRLDRDQLIRWLKDPEVMKSRKRLYYTLLGVCGTEKELVFLEDVIRSGDRDRQAGLDALIACYLTLKGDEGMPLVESTFLNNPEAEYIDVFSAITALRFHGTESDKVSRDRIVEALRFVLDRPRMADMVIPDLARWEDWSVMSRLVEMFKECDTDETRWVRTPIISYLQACPIAEAKTHIAELREIDPQAAKRADMLSELDWGDEDEDEDDEDETGDGAEAVGETENENETGDDGDGDQDNSLSGILKISPTNECMQPENNRQESLETVAQPDLFDDHPVLTTANPPVATYVSTEVPGNSAAETHPDRNEGPESSDPANEQLAQRANPALPAAMIVPSSPSVAIMILVTLAVCTILFLLLWSVLNGTFERLIV